MEFRNSSIQINEGEFIIVPKQTEHRPNAKQEVWVMLFEPATTINTGEIKNELTKKQLGKI